MSETAAINEMLEEKRQAEARAEPAELEVKCADREVMVRQVIITTNSTRGRGIEGDPIRRVRQIWSMDGELLAEKDFA